MPIVLFVLPQWHRKSHRTWVKTKSLIVSHSPNGWAPGDAGTFRCVVSNSCGSVTSAAATLTVCPADFDCDGFVTGDDYDAYRVVFIAGDSAADFDGDGFVTGDDFDGYVTAFVAGC